VIRSAKLPESNLVKTFEADVIRVIIDIDIPEGGR
jgi:hypothetical protein